MDGEELRLISRFLLQPFHHFQSHAFDKEAVPTLKPHQHKCAAEFTSPSVSDLQLRLKPRLVIALVCQKSS